MEDTKGLVAKIQSACISLVYLLLSLPKLTSVDLVVVNHLVYILTNIVSSTSRYGSHCTVITYCFVTKLYKHLTYMTKLILLRPVNLFELWSQLFSYCLIKKN